MGTLKPANQIISEAKNLIEEAQKIELPAGGNERGHAVVKIRSRLGNAEKLLSKLTHPRWIEIYSGTYNQSEFDQLKQEIGRLWPNVLSQK